MPRRAAPLVLGLCLLSASTARPLLAQAPADAPLAPPPSAGGSPPAEQAGSSLLDLNLDQLSNTDVVVPALDMPVTTVTRQESTVGRSAAAVFVIDQEMIERSGARTIPDLLRMAPGVNVAHIDANRWAVSVRGFNGQFTNKLLVQIDGRVVYTPLFGGVFWDVQDVVIEDIERIEVIRGPGATLWGANAVNGVINILTKRARDTQGTLVVAGGGTEERAFSTARYGGNNGSDLHWRVYAKQFERDAGFSTAPFGTHDDWRQARTGFRADWTPTSEDLITLQGDVYNGYSGGARPFQQPLPPFFSIVPMDDHVAGGNTIFRWSRQLDDETGWILQSFYDRTERQLPTFAEDRDTYDVDYQYRFPLGAYQRLIWGCGYRRTQDSTQGSFGLEFDPPTRGTDLYSCFLQDELTLVEDRSYFTTGCRYIYNDFTGSEWQPTARLLFLPSERQSVWAAISRAVRTPTRADDDIIIRWNLNPAPPIFAEYRGNRGVVSEDLMAYEIGYRAQPTDAFSWDLALFYNDYRNLLGTVPGAPYISAYGLVAPYTADNNQDAEAYGAELAATWRILENWSLFGAYSFLQIQVHGTDTAGPIIEGSSPHNQFYLQSSWNLSCNVQFDLIGRYVDNLPALGVPSYLTMDARVAWLVSKNLDVAIVGRNLLDSHHLEFIDASGFLFGTEIERSVYGIATWRR